MNCLIKKPKRGDQRGPSCCEKVTALLTGGGILETPQNLVSELKGIEKITQATARNRQDYVNSITSKVTCL